MGKRKAAERGWGSIAIPILIIIMAVVGGYLLLQRSRAPQPGPLQEPGAENLPDFAYASQDSLRAYMVALRIPEVLEKIPCYCGCVSMEHLGVSHKHLRDCFIFDDGTFDDHASYCDICIYEALDVDRWYKEGVPVREIRTRIDAKYGGGKYGPPTKTPPVDEEVVAAPVQPMPDLAAPGANLSLAPGFRSMSDALKLTPEGAVWARFINIPALVGGPLELYASGRIQPEGFYGRRLVGMYSADYSADSWIELHDVGYDDPGIKPRLQPGMENIVNTRPFIYGHAQNVERMAALQKGAGKSSYPTFAPLLDPLDDEGAAVVEVSLRTTPFSDMDYLGLDPAPGGVERVSAYHIARKEALPIKELEELKGSSKGRGLEQYEFKVEGDLLVVRMVGGINAVLAEKLP